MYKFVKNNLEKINVFNVVLAVVAMIFTSRLLFVAGTSILDIVTCIASIIGLLSGLLYILSSYKKNANGYYKGFMIIYALQSVSVVISKFFHDLALGSYAPLSIFTTVCMALGAVCIIILALVKNLGVSKSLILAAVNFWATIGTGVLSMIFIKGFVGVPELWLSPITIATLAFVFVCAKYADKEARGAK